MMREALDLTQSIVVLTIVDDFHWFTTFIKFGIARATWDACPEIGTNEITREEGVSLVKK